MVKAHEGHGSGESYRAKRIDLPPIPLCRFGFPRPPMDETTVLLGFNREEDKDLVKTAKVDYLSIRKYLFRQTYVPDKSNLDDQPGWKKLRTLTFKAFLKQSGMYSYISLELSEEDQFQAAKVRYHNALRAGIKGYACVFPKRNCKNIFTNNFNKKLMEIHSANHDIQLCIDPYSVAQYVVGYLSKNESGISVLLKKN